MTDETSSPVTLSSEIKTVDASSRTKAVKVTGNAQANSIVGGSGNDSLSGGDGKDTLSGNDGNDKLLGGDGNDSLWGGAGNDTIWGGDGSDVFVYKANEGKDYIMDFTANDMLQILKADGSQGSFTKSSFKNSSLTLAVEGGGKVYVGGATTSDTFNINDKTYGISGGKLVKK